LSTGQSLTGTVRKQSVALETSFNAIQEKVLTNKLPNFQEVYEWQLSEFSYCQIQPLSNSTTVEFNYCRIQLLAEFNYSLARALNTKIAMKPHVYGLPQRRS
jgi:hypothetical protein